MATFSRKISEFGAESVLRFDDAQEVKLTITVHAAKKSQVSIIADRTIHPECGNDSFSDDLNPRKEVCDINDILTDLSTISEIYKFDRGIINQNRQQITPHQCDGVELEKLKELKDFYSPKEEERKNAFTRCIKDPLLKVLGKIGKFCSKLSGEAKHIALFSILDEPEVKVKYCGLLEVAIQEIFSDEHKGLSALEQALKALQEDPENIDETVLESLSLYRSMVGFFYDQKAAQHLIGLSKGIPRSDTPDETVRLAMLMFLQMAGEYCDRLLPETFSLCINITDTAKTHLRDMRDVLSHLNITKLEKVFLDDATKTFKDARDDIERLTTDFQNISDEYETLWKENQENPTNLWSRFKTPRKMKDNSKDASDAQTLWSGIEGVKNFFHQSKNDQENLNDDLINSISPYSLDLVLVKDYFSHRNILNDVIHNEARCKNTTEGLFEELSDRRRDSLWEVLKTKTKKEGFEEFLKEEVKGVTTKIPLTDDSVDTLWKMLERGDDESFFRELEQERKKLICGAKELLLKNLKQEARGASAESLSTEDECGTLWEKVRTHRKELAKLTNEGEKKEAEHAMQHDVDTFIDQMLHVSPDDKQREDEKHESLKKSQQKFKALLQKEQQNACRGNGNISLKYKDFLKKLKAKGVTILDDPSEFSWTSEPASNVEKLFHKVHKTGIFTRAGKDALRRTVIKRTLRVIDYLQEKVKIKTDIASEVQKECRKEIICGKEQLMEKAIKLLKEDGQQSDTKQLCDMGTSFLETLMKIKYKDPDDDEEVLVDRAHKTRDEFVKEWKNVANTGMSPLLVDLMPNLENTKADKYFEDINRRVEVEGVIENPRNHWIINNAAQEIRKTFQTYKKEMCNYLKEYNRPLDDALQHLGKSNTGKIIDEKLNGIRITIQNRLNVLPLSEDAQQFFDKANEIQDLIDELRDHHDYLSSTWDKFMKNVTDSFQEYQTKLLAYQFVVATGCEMLNNICDYPELDCLKPAILVRHAIFHNNNPFDQRLWENIVRNPPEFNIPSTFEGHVAKELSILAVGVRCVLNKLYKSLK